MLGVINVVTKSASAVNGTRVVAEAFFVPPATRGDDPNHRASYWSDSGRGGRVAVLGGYAFRLFDKPAQATFELQYAHRDAPAYSHAFPVGPTLSSHTETLRIGLPSAFARLTVGDWELNVRAARANRATTIPAETWMYVTPNGPYGPAATEGFDQWLNTDLQYTKALSPMVTLTARAFGDIGESVRTSTTYDAIISCDVWMPRGCRHENPTSSRWGGAEARTNIRWLADNSLSTMVGVIGWLRRIEGAVNYFEIASGTPATYDHFRLNEVAGAAYVQQNWSPVDWLNLNAGARWDYEERFGSKVSPRAAVVFQLWRGSSLKGVYSEAFRGPSIRESFASDPTRRLLAGPLKPESVRSIEAALEQQWGAHRLTYGVFRTWWSELVGSRGYIDVVGGVSGGSEADHLIMAAAKARGELFSYVLNGVQYQNLATIDNYGLQAAYTGSGVDRRLNYGMNVTAARAYRSGQSTDSFLTTAPVLAGNARIAYDLHPTFFTTGLAAHWMGVRYAESTYGAVFPRPPKAPTQVELRLTLTGQVPGVPRLRYQAVGSVSTNGRGAYLAAMPPLYPGFPPTAVLRPVERFWMMLGVDYEF
jgi:outer membrane receptor protein involved in Fe transport